MEKLDAIVQRPPSLIRRMKSSYLDRNIHLGLKRECVDEEEHGVDSQTQSQEGDNLSGGGIEGDAQEGSQAHASSNIHGHQEDSSQAQTCLGPHLVRPSVQGGNSVHNLKYII